MSNLKKIREAQNITQADLAKKSGVNIRMIQKYEQGDRNINKAQGETLLSLAKTLKCNIENILE